jgi:hypothetical protein
MATEARSSRSVMIWKSSSAPRLTVIAERAARLNGDRHPVWVTAVLTTHAQALTSATPGDLIPGADGVRAPGAEHPSTLTASANAAHRSDEAEDAAGLRDQFAALMPVTDRILRDEHPDTPAARADVTHGPDHAGDAAASPE